MKKMEFKNYPDPNVAKTKSIIRGISEEFRKVNGIRGEEESTDVIKDLMVLSERIDWVENQAQCLIKLTTNIKQQIQRCKENISD